MLGWNGMKATRREGTYAMTITEIVLTASDFQTLIDTLEAGIKHVEDEEHYPDEQRGRVLDLDIMVLYPQSKLVTIDA
jgi:hypothetical protein